MNKLNTETVDNILTYIVNRSFVLRTLIADDMISSASNFIGGGIEQFIANGIVDVSKAGFDLSSMMVDLTSSTGPFEVCYCTLDATK